MHRRGVRHTQVDAGGTRTQRKYLHRPLVLLGGCGCPTAPASCSTRKERERGGRRDEEGGREGEREEEEEEEGEEESGVRDTSTVGRRTATRPRRGNDTSPGEVDEVATTVP